nr:uncharacterized protein LOC126548618 isoform X1 [Dermacentor andersoni]
MTRWKPWFRNILNSAHLGSTSGPEIVNNDASHGCPHDPFECFVFCKSMEHEFFFCVGLRQHLCLCNTDTPIIWGLAAPQVPLSVHALSWSSVKVSAAHLGPMNAQSTAKRRRPRKVDTAPEDSKKTACASEIKFHIKRP